jgi:hypothetical protein
VNYVEASSFAGLQPLAIGEVLLVMSAVCQVSPYALPSYGNSCLCNSPNCSTP